MFLLLSATALSFLLLRPARPLLSSGLDQRQVVGSFSSHHLFDLKALGKTVAVTAGVIMIGMVLATWIGGRISGIDLAGFSICGAIIGFIARLLILSTKPKSVGR